MMRQPFDDAALEESSLVDNEDLRWLAGAGARIRQAALTEPRGPLDAGNKPRGILVMGAEARLVRSVLEPVCPVPFMAWPGPMLPAWVGPMDLVIVLGGHHSPEWELHCAAEAARRGASIVVAAPEDSELTRAASSHNTIQIPALGNDAVAAAVAVMALLGQLGLGPDVDAEQVASTVDLVSEQCSPRRDLASNRGKELAIGLADGMPLIWGGSVLAQRAARRIAQSLRRASGRVALAADAEELEPVLLATAPRDPFSDPFETEAPVPPVLLMLDLDSAPERTSQVGNRLLHLAEQVGMRVCHISSGEPDVTTAPIERYVVLLQTGRYAAAYLGIGHGISAGERR